MLLNIQRNFATTTDELSTLKPIQSRPLKILVLCTGNSARSVMAEGLFNGLAGRYFQAYSAGSHPSGKVNPFALEQIAPLNLTYTARSKSWDEFAQNDAVELDLVLTVCGNAAQEICPHFVGAPQRIHWGLPDPAGVTGSDAVIRTAFNDCYRIFEWRVQQLLSQLKEGSLSEILSLMRNLSDKYPSNSKQN